MSVQLWLLKIYDKFWGQVEILIIFNFYLLTDCCKKNEIIVKSDI